MSNVKTNAMRILDKAGITYKIHTYDSGGEAIDGETVATMIGEPVEKVYKTLVTQGYSKAFYVFVIPVKAELDLKSGAKAVGEKSIEMIKVMDINKVTGYVRGGCSPVGMKKDYKTILDASCESIDSIIVSAGKIGYQIELSPKDLIYLTKCQVMPVLLSTIG